MCRSGPVNLRRGVSGSLPAPMPGGPDGRPRRLPPRLSPWFSMPRATVRGRCPHSGRPTAPPTCCSPRIRPVCPKVLTSAPRGANTIDALNDGSGSASAMLPALSALEFDLSVYDIFALFAAGGALVAWIPISIRDCHVGEVDRRTEVSRHQLRPRLFDMLSYRSWAGTAGDSLGAVILGGDWVGANLARRLAALRPAAGSPVWAGRPRPRSTPTLRGHRRIAGPLGNGPFGIPLRNVRCRVVMNRGPRLP